jgi:hypothetical protein
VNDSQNTRLSFPKLITCLAIILLAHSISAADRSVAECKQQRQKLRFWLAAFSKLSEAGPKDRVRLPAPQGQPFRQNQTAGPHAEVGPDMIRLGSQVITNIDRSLIDKLKDLLKKSRPAELKDQGKDFALQLIISESLPWFKTATFFEAAQQAGFKRVALLYRLPSTSIACPRGFLFSAGLYWYLFPATSAALVMTFAEPGSPEAHNLGMPGIVPWKVAFRKIQKAVEAGQALAFTHERK